MVWVPWVSRENARFAGAIKKKREQLRVLALDEAQDTDLLQIEILSELIDPERSFLVGVGDRHQCVIEGTLLSLVDGSAKPCEAIEVGDAIATGWGANQVGKTQVEEVYVRSVQQQPVIRIKTKGGYEVTTTPEHIHFAGYTLGSQDICYFTYLMEKEGVGFRVGTTQRYRRFASTNQLGYKSRTQQERADKIWILEVSRTEAEARYWEAYYSAAFGLPTVTFLEVNRHGTKERGNDDLTPLGMAQKEIDRLFNSLPTKENAYRLLELKNMLYSHPHHTPKCTTTRRRRNFVITMCADSRSPNCCLHRAELGGSDTADAKLLESIGVKVTTNGKENGGWRARYESRNLKNIYKMLYQVESVMDINVVEKAALTRSGALPFCPAAHVRQGMLMAVQIGARIELDTVETVEQTTYTGNVYDFKVDRTHNFIANGIVTHNSVYFFRGFLSDGLERIATRFHGENLPLPICYRCGVQHLELVRSIFPHIPIQPRPNAPDGQVQVIWEKDFLSIFNNAALSYMGVCRKNAPLTIAAIQLLAAGKPAKIKDRNIGSRLVSRVREICQRKRYTSERFPQLLREYEIAQKRRLAKFPDGEIKVSELDDVLQAIAALFQAYEPKTLKAWEEIVSRIFDESGYSPISLYSIHSGKGGEGQVTFILSPNELPLEHPKQVEEERAQEQNLLYVALTRTLADGVDGAGMLFLVIREDQDGKPKYPAWLPDKYRTLKVVTRSPDPDSSRSDNSSLWSSEDSEMGWTELADEILDELGSHVVIEDFSANNSSQAISQSETVMANNCSDVTKEEVWETATETFDGGVEQQSSRLPETETQPLESTAGVMKNCSSSNLSLEELEEKIRRGFNLTRDFYECGRSLTLVRDRALYVPNFNNFEEYCEQRFGKSLRLAQYFMSAAVVVDNLLEAECAILPTAESQVRAIASLPTHQQVEIWQKACSESKGVPIASKVREVKAAVLGEPMPERTFKSEHWVKLPNPSTLLEHLKDRLKETKVSLKDVEVLLKLIQELNYGDR